MLLYPLDKIFITQRFGERPQVYKPFKGHTGIDFRTIFDDSPTGKRSVFASARGTVLEIGNQGTKGYGRFVRIQHLDGAETVYGHLTEWYVKKEQALEAGTRIALSGNTGFSSAPHLHFGYRPPHYTYNNGFAGYADPLSLFLKNIPETHPDTLSAQPLSLMKKTGSPAIYIYGYDNLWHGLQDMSILQTLHGTYDKNKVLVVGVLPSNIGKEIFYLKDLN